MKGGDAISNPRELEMRREGWSPTKRELKEKFENNKKRYVKDLTQIEKGWVSKKNLHEALLEELADLNRRNVENGLKPITGANFSSTNTTK